MHHFLYILLLLSTILPASGQQILLETGKLMSQFRYQDSRQVRMTNLRPGTQTYISGSFRIGLQPTQRFHLIGGISFQSYSAAASLDSLQTHMTWDAHYAGVHTGVDIELFKNRNLVEHRRGVTIYLRSLFSTEFVLYGTQTLNQQSYNLVGAEQFNKPLYFIRSGVGVSYCIAKDLACYAQYMGGLSMSRSRPGAEQLRMITHQIGIGLILSLGKCEYCYGLHY